MTGIRNFNFGSVSRRYWALHHTPPGPFEGWAHKIGFTVADATGSYGPGVLSIDLSEIPHDSGDPDDFWDNVLSDGGDLRAADASGNRLAMHIVDPLDTGARTGWIHVRLETITNNEQFYLYYGKAGESQPAVDAAFGREATYAEDKSRWLFNTDPSGAAPQLIDVTGNGHDGTTQNMESGDAEVNGGVPQWGFDGSGEQAALDGDFFNASNLSNDFAITCWADLTASTEHDYYLWGLAGSSTPRCFLRFNSFDEVRAVFRPAGTAYDVIHTGATDFVRALRRYTVHVKSGTMRLYIDGSEAGSVAVVGSMGGNADDFLVGQAANAPAQDAFEGAFGPMRAALAWTADQEATEYACESDQATFWTIASPEPNS